MVQMILKQHEVYGFIQKMKQLNLKQILLMTMTQNKAKLLANTETQPNPNNPDEILKNATIAV